MPARAKTNSASGSSQIKYLPTMSTFSNKRKVDDLTGSGEGSGRPPPALRKEATASAAPDELHLPAPVWGHVMDYMPYDEVRSALLICKMIANEAVKYVQTLNIMMSCQLVGPPARRFPNVEEVNCLCLFTVESDMPVDESFFCQRTALRFVPLLTMFPKLKSASVMGTIKSEDHSRRQFYFPSDFKNIEARYHIESFKALVYSFIGAMQAKVLPSALENVEGITGAALLGSKFCHRYHGDDWEGGGPCFFCRDLLLCFPIKNLIEDPLTPCECLEYLEMLEFLAKQRDSRILKIIAREKITDCLLGACRTYPLDVRNVRGEGGEAKMLLVEKLRNLGVTVAVPRVTYITKSSFQLLDDHIGENQIGEGFGPKDISKENVYDALCVGRSDDRRTDIFAKSTIDSLVARGFSIDPNDLIIIDECAEPALKEVCTLMSR